MTPGAPADLFDPAHYARVRQPVGESGTLPAWCYTSPEFHAREIERIFTPGWHFVGRADEVAEPGSYLAVDTVPGPLLLLRDAAARRALVSIMPFSDSTKSAVMSSGDSRAAATACGQSFDWISSLRRSPSVIRCGSRRAA